MKALEQYNQTAFWEIEVNPSPVTDEKTQTSYQLNFKLIRSLVKLYNRISHYYLLQTSLDKEDYSTRQIHENYKGLYRIEQCFWELKSSLEIRPIRHWKEKRIKAHIYLSYLSLWLLKYIENKWKEKKITRHVKTTLSDWNDILKLCQLLDWNNKQVNLKWNRGENANQSINQIDQYGEFSAIKTLL